MEEPARLPHRPLLKPWYGRSTGQGRAVLRYGGSVLEFEGAAAERLLPRLFPLLDGTRTVDEIAAELGEPVRPALDNALAVLHERSLLVDPPPRLARPTARSVELLAGTDRRGRPLAETAAAATTSRTCVLGSAPAADLVQELLRDSGVASTRSCWTEASAHDCDLAIVAPGDGEDELLREWNRAALARGTAWLQVLGYDGLAAAVGPVFVPGESACHECYRLRRSANVSAVADAGGGPWLSSPPLDAVLAGLAAFLALRHLALHDRSAVGVMLAVELSPPACVRHVLYRVPRCPVCGPSERRAALAPFEEVADVAA